MIGASLDSIWEAVLSLNEKVERLPSLIEIAGHQINIVSLDELSETLGLIKAGEFRAGNLNAPGDSFSGVRIGYPGFYYPGTSTVSSDFYNIVGVDADTLQFGLRSSDGVAVAGAGAVELNADGIVITQGQGTVNTIVWIDTSVGEYPAELDADLVSLFGYNVAPSTSAQQSNFVISVEGGLDSDLSSNSYTTNTISYAQTNWGALAQGNLLSFNTIQRSRISLWIGADTGVIPSAGVWLVLRDLAESGASDAEDLNVNVFEFSSDPADPGLFWGRTPDLTGTDGSAELFFAFYGLSTGTPYLHLDGNFDYAIFGASDTTNLNLGYLNEKALTFASTATAGIEDPDNEMGKLWMDTDFEMRLTDTAGEDWFVTKSTSTEGGNPTFSRAWAEAVVDIPGAGWVGAAGSDTATFAETGEFTFNANTVWELIGRLRVQATVANFNYTLFGISIMSSAGVVVWRDQCSVGDSAEGDVAFSGASYFDSGRLTPGTVYRGFLDFYDDSGAATRNYTGDQRAITLNIHPRLYTVTT